MTSEESWARRVCGIGDEAASGLASQLAIHKQLGMSAIELRTVDGQWLHRLPAPEREEVAHLIRDSGLRVTVIDTPVGGWSTSIAADLNQELTVLEGYAAAAHSLGCKYLRVMSYPNDGRPYPLWKAESIRRMRALVREARSLDVVLLHENCQGWASGGPAQTLQMLDEVNDPRLRLLFDLGNGIEYGYETLEFLPHVLPWIDHVHVKDGRHDRTGKAEFTYPGGGLVDLPRCIRLLEESGYQGWYSLEPHISFMPHSTASPEPGELARIYHAYAARFRQIWEGVTSHDKSQFPDGQHTPEACERRHLRARLADGDDEHTVRISAGGRSS